MTRLVALLLTTALLLPVAPVHAQGATQSSPIDTPPAQLKPGATAALADVVTRIKATQDPVVLTVGHTDSVGSDAYNQKLSAQRAQAVRAYLIAQGVEASRITAEGRGESQPVAPNDTPANKALNRRVEFIKL